MSPSNLLGAMTLSQETQTAVVRVYDSYDITHPPRHPGPGWTRFVCISDNHSYIFPVPPGDVLLHSGDLTYHGTFKDLEITVNWLKSLPHPAKFFIGGNHDLCLDDNYKEGGIMRSLKPSGLSDKDISAAAKLIHSKTLRKAGLFYLEHNSADYIAKSGKTYTIYGSPAAPFYSIGAFQYKAGEGKAVYDRIPASTNILLTHTPPHGICDVTKRGKHAGCPDLAERLKADDLHDCRLHVYGHIHEARGFAMVGQTTEKPGRVSVNAALPNMPLPIIVDFLD